METTFFEDRHWRSIYFLLSNIKKINFYTPILLFINILNNLIASIP